MPAVSRLDPDSASAFRTIAGEHPDANEEGTEVRLGFNEWQTIQAVQLLLAKYTRAIGEPDGEM